ncbi:MAG: hypothetical protein N2204_08135, partial [Anaerolineae bacterium]|nr:hypothetical protein [Anaerolineae bacterium]
MPDLIIHPSGPLRGETTVPGDKSITHRAIILASLAEGETRIRGWVPAEVCLATLRCMRALGAEIEEVSVGANENATEHPERRAMARSRRGEAEADRPHPSTTLRSAQDADDSIMPAELLIRGRGLHGLREPDDVLHCAGSGTTIRLLAGLLAGQPFTSVLTGTEP